MFLLSLDIDSICDTEGKDAFTYENTSDKPIM